MIYEFLKLLIRIAIRVFYKNVKTYGKENLIDSGSIIAVGNHPNTFMDPLIVATTFKQQVGFLGNASVFVHPIVNAIFGYFNVIRVYRKKDLAEGETSDNADAFRESYKYLSENNSLLIFPEGNSYREMMLRKIKTGAARIAFNTEEKNDYKLGIKIIPFGLNYSSPGRFRSKLNVNIGKAIEVKEFINDYKKDSIEGVRLLTDKIRTSLEEVLITTKDEEHESLFIKLKQIYKGKLIAHLNKEANPNLEYKLTKEFSKAIQAFRINDPSKYLQVKEKIEAYTQTVKELNLRGNYNKVITSMAKRIIYTVSGVFYSIIGFPLYVFGLIQNYLPFRIPFWIAKKITLHIEYHAPIMMTIGIFLFPIYYFMSWYLFANQVPDNNWIYFGYILLMPLTGFYCLHYLEFLKNLKSFFKLNPIFKSADKKVKDLIALKKDITLIMDDVNRVYLKEV